MKFDKNFYEIFHKNTKVQRKIITPRDYTYGPILKILACYSKSRLRVLDVGCGAGLVDFYLASLGNSVYGIDISDRAIRSAVKSSVLLNLGNKLTFETANFTKKKIRKKFNLVICLEILEHMEDDMAVVSKIRSLLTSNGIVVASSPSLNAPLYRLGYLRKFDQKVGHLRRYSEIEFENLFINNGFKIKKIQKAEGVLRNYLFTSRIGHHLLKIINKWPFSEIFTFIDNLTIPIFGESDIQIVAIKK